MIKILILFAIVILSGALGLAVSAEKRREKIIFTQFYDFNEKLILNLKYGREKVRVIAEEYEYVKKTFNGVEVLKGEHGEFLKAYVAGVGGSDALTQIDYLHEKKVNLQNFKQKSEENYKKYGSLYFKLSIMAGILIAVLLA